MKKRLTALFLSVIICLFFTAFSAAAVTETGAVSGNVAETETAAPKSNGEFELTLDVNYRETNIVYENNGSNNAAENDENRANKIVYIAVLSVLLVIAIVILVVTLRRVPDEKNIEIEDGAEKKKE